MQTLKHIDEISIARIYLVLMFIVGVIVDLILLAASGFAHGMRLGPLASLGIGAFAVIIPIILAIGGFVFGAIIAFLYNVFADRIGGIRITLSSGRLKAVDPMSNGKMLGTFGAVIGAVVGIIFIAFGGLVARYIPVLSGAVLGFLGIILFFVLVVGFGIAYFVIGVIEALVYNFLAQNIGPIVLNFKGKELKSIGVLSYAKIEGAGGLIIGFVGGLLTFSVVGFITQVIVSPVTAFMVSGIIGFAYNWTAKWMGGVALTIS